MNSNLRELFNMSISVNNESTYDKVNNKIIGGNITDKALLNYSKEYKCDYSLIKREEFDSRRKYMYTKMIIQSKSTDLSDFMKTISKDCL